MSVLTEPRQVYACNAPYGRGGLGRHFSELVEQARDAGRLAAHYSPEPRQDDPTGITVGTQLARALLRYTPVRFNLGWSNFVACDQFDRAVRRALAGPLDAFVGFGAQSLLAFARARALGSRRNVVVAACSLVDNVARRHARAIGRYPVEPSWMNDAYRRKCVAEYGAADGIIVASEDTRRTFLDAGVPEHKLLRVHFRTDPRYVPPAHRERGGVFRIVYTGSVTVTKGVPVLLDAFARFRDLPAELTLVGGTATRAMHRYVADQIARDGRIRIAPGDPLPHLQRADLYVHPSFEDGLAYAPLEALACGVLVIVSEDTGMKEYVREGINGYVVPTGDVDAIVERMCAVAAGRLGAATTADSRAADRVTGVAC
jgi:glycosyltransferase involved in cell wall biosynthesis